YELRERDDFKLGCCVLFDVVYPLTSSEIYTTDANEISLSVIIRYGNFEMFLGGDLGSALEEKIFAAEDNPDIDVLKVGHHGSKTSTSKAMLELSRPEVAIVSAGADNSYGHPAPVVLTNLQEANST